MMGLYFQGLTMGLAYVAPIGMQNLFVINSALTRTRRNALITAVIVIFFDIVLSLACFFGIGALMQAHPWLQTVVLGLGGAVVVRIGLGLLLPKKKSTSENGAGAGAVAAATASTASPYYNYAAGYVMLFTALIQYMVWQFVRRRFDEKRREMLMGKLEEINQKRIAEALESEKKSLAKVSRSDQLRIDLITNVSHDLKTPLTSMVGYIELIKKEELSDLVRDYVDVLSERAEKLKEMINSLFSLAKASSGNIELHPEKFELNRLVEQIFADMHDHVKESELQFVKQLTEENTEIISDNMYFYRICQNLIENALKYSAKHTRVFVKTYQKESSNHLCLEITNTAGYPMDFTKEEIIERFFRGDKQRSSEGNGLGLAIVSTYVKALGGEFDIKIDCDQFKACVEMPLSAITIT